MENDSSVNGLLIPDGYAMLPFLGRKEEIRQIRSLLRNRSVFLVGPMGIGKSAVLSEISKEIPNVFHVALSQIAPCKFAQEFFRHLINLMLESAASRAGFEELVRLHLEEQLFERFPNPSTIIVDLCKLRENRDAPLLIIIDDFEKLREFPCEHEVIQTFQTLMDDFKELEFLFASDIYLDRESATYITPFGNKIELYPLKPMSLTDARLFIRQSEQQGVKFEDSAIEQVMNLTGNIPLLLRVVCSSIIEILNRKGMRLVTEEVIGEVGDRVLVVYEQQFFQKWWSALTGIEQLTLLIMVHISKDSPNLPTADELEHKIESFTGLKVSTEGVLSLLSERGFIRLEGTRYNLASDLFRIRLAEVEKEWILGGLVELAINPLELNHRIIQSRLQPAWKETPMELRSRKYHRNPIILHISDIQYGQGHAFVDIPEDYHDSLLNRLVSDIERNFPLDKIPTPNLIVISGDVADWAMPDEYNRATNFIRKLCEKLQALHQARSSGKDIKIDETSVVIVPGNHDINWALSRAGLDQIAGNQEAHPNSLYSYRTDTFREWFNQLYKGQQVFPLDPENRFNIYDLTSEFGLLIVGFDSCYQEDHLHNWGYISPQAIARAEDKIKAIINPELVDMKIAVWHHNVKPSDNDRNDILRNYELVLQELSYYGYSVALHGHVHEPQQINLSSNMGQGFSMEIFGAGSIGVRTKARPGSTEIGFFPLSYNIVELELNQSPQYIRVHTREMTPINGSITTWSAWAGWSYPNRLYFERLLMSNKRPGSKLTVQPYP